jgi:hypothetical protein
MLIFLNTSKGTSLERSQYNTTQIVKFYINMWIFKTRLSNISFIIHTYKALNNCDQTLQTLHTRFAFSSSLYFWPCVCHIFDSYSLPPYKLEIMAFLQRHSIYSTFNVTDYRDSLLMSAVTAAASAPFTGQGDNRWRHGHVCTCLLHLQR